MQIRRNVTDEWLMLRVSKGDLDKLSILFKRYHVPLYNFFRRLYFSKAQSEDLTQSVFERIIKYRTGYKGGKFKSWCYQIARNVKNDFYRQKVMQYDDFVEIGDLKYSERNTEKEIIEAETKATLHIALRKLTPEQREVLILTKFQKLKYAEVGKILNCTEGAVKVKVHRALKQLRKVYFKLEQP